MHFCISLKKEFLRLVKEKKNVSEVLLLVMSQLFVYITFFFSDSHGQAYSSEMEVQQLVDANPLQKIQIHSNPGTVRQDTTVHTGDLSQK